MKPRWKAMGTIAGTAAITTVVLLALLATGIINLPVLRVGLPATGLLGAESKYYQPPLDRGYETVPLDSRTVRVGAVQMAIGKVDPKDPLPGIAANLKHMLELSQQAYDKGVRLAVFDEFTLTGSAAIRGDRKPLIDGAAIRVPGPETKAIGEFAKEHNMYIAFSSIWQEPEEWPGHFFNGAIIIGPSGDIILKDWKSYYGYPGIGFEYSTSVYDVQDEFVKKYGWDAVNPVVKTPIGNLSAAICSDSFFNSAWLPMVYAMKGAEIYLHMYGGSGWDTWQGRMMNIPIGIASQNMMWVVHSNSASLTGPDDPANSSSGSAQIIDPAGNVTARSTTIREDIVTYDIPIGEFRDRSTQWVDNNLMTAVPTNNFSYYGNAHLPPSYRLGGIRTSQVIKELERFPAQFPPNLLTEYQRQHNGQLPPTYCDTRAWYFQHQKWQSDYIEAGNSLCPTISSKDYPVQLE